MTYELYPCACTGPVGRDLVCPCAMRATGLLPSPGTTADNHKLMEALRTAMRQMEIDRLPNTKS